MKTLLTFLLLVLVGINIKAQTNHVEILIGQTELEVTEYLNSLIQYSSNKDLKIKKDVTTYGDLVLTLELPLNDEERLHALSMVLVFYRFGKDMEICIRQGVFGRAKHSYGNISYMKDNFKLISDNQWERPYDKIPDAFKVTGQFTKNDSSYDLVYKLVEIKKGKSAQ